MKQILKKNIKIKNFILKNFINLSSQEKKMVLNWRNNENVRKNCFSDRIITYKEHENFIRNLKKDKKNFYFLVVKGKEYIGVISLNKVDFYNKNAYLGIYTNPNLKGVGKYLMECLKEISFKKLNLHTLKLEVLETNKKAIEFYKKNGFKIEGKLKEFVCRNGGWIDVFIMGIINEKNKF